MTAKGDNHDPVMLDRVVELLAPSLAVPDAVYVDCTLGLGGHARAVLEAAPWARLIGIDRDPDALAVARERLGSFAERITLVKAVYDELPEVLADLGIDQVHAVLADLGVSSLQIDREERGFAYRVDAPLDMRMSGGEGRSAADLLNSASPVELVRILRGYGEEKYAERIVSAIVREREIHPAKRSFQALRIEVNDELGALERFLPAATGSLALEGRIVVLAYHSLEDRPVKRHLATLASDGAPRDMPIVPEYLQPRFRLLTRGAERPSEQEIQSNPRAASARLRAAARIKEA